MFFSLVYFTISFSSFHLDLQYLYVIHESTGWFEGYAIHKSAGWFEGYTIHTLHKSAVWFEGYAYMYY